MPPKSKRSARRCVRSVPMQLLGKFGQFGGVYVPEPLMPALEELEDAFLRYSGDAEFIGRLNDLLANYAGRPTPLYHAVKERSRMRSTKPCATGSAMFEIHTICWARQRDLIPFRPSLNSFKKSSVRKLGPRCSLRTIVFPTMWWHA